jgi:Na+/proline symporter
LADKKGKQMNMMKNLKLLWGIWMASLGVTCLGAAILELNGGISQRGMIYIPLACLFAFSYFALLAHGRRT